MQREKRREQFRVPPEWAGIRADVAFAHHLSPLTRTQVRKMMRSGLILIEGEPAKPSKKLSGGEMVQVTIPPPEPIDVKPEDIYVPIVHEDGDIVVVNKPSGMTVHPGAGVIEGTLVNALLSKCPDLSGIGGVLRPGIIHRLDKDTSGVMVVAKNDDAHLRLSKQFEARTVEKVYLAVVVGDIKGDSGVFDRPVGRHPTSRVKMSVRSKTPRSAITHWRVLERHGGATVLEVRPKTGRTHQIRVHFKEHGYPLLGDRVYFLKKFPTHTLKSLSAELGRHALHAASIGFDHPRSGERVVYEAPLATDIRDVIDALRREG